MRLVASLLLIFGTLAGAAAENTLTPAEKKEGWTLLFDGKTMNGWLDPAKKDKPGTGWKVEDGTLATVQGALIREDLITAKSYGDFELKFDWKLTPGGNTGLKYRIQRELLMDQSKMEKGPGWIRRHRRPRDSEPEERSENPRSRCQGRTLHHRVRVPTPR
jgi:hypothetical protein